MISFTAHGIPAPKGSLKAFVRGGRAIVTNDNAKTKPWASVVTHAAMEAMGGDRAMLTGPVSVRIMFRMPRPLAHRRRDGSVRPGAAGYSSTKPDVDKLIRTVLDALTVAGVWLDDGQVASLHAEKIYTDSPGVTVFVERAVGL